MRKKDIQRRKVVLAKRLLDQGYMYNPEYDPDPVIKEMEYGKGRWLLTIGGTCIVVSAEKANRILVILQLYRDTEIKTYRSGGLVTTTNTPFSDLQDELDKGMGVVGIILAIVFALLISIAYFLVKHYS